MVMTIIAVHGSLHVVTAIAPTMKRVSVISPIVLSLVLAVTSVVIAARALCVAMFMMMTVASCQLLLLL